MPKLKIKRKDIKTVNTKYGDKEKHNFLLESSKGEFWAGCFANAVTASWKEGDTVDMELKAREYQGKTYWDIIPPKPHELIMQELGEIKEMLSLLLTGGSGKSSVQDDLVDEVPPPDDAPPPEDDDIPF